MSAILLSGKQFLDNNGNPAPSGSVIRFFDAGTTDLKGVFSDSSLSTAVADNLALDADGRLPVTIYVADGERYYWEVRTQASGGGSIVDSQDDVWGYTNADFQSTSITTLKALTPSNNDVVLVKGYATPGDGGGGQYVFDSSSAAADNGGSIIAPNSGSGRWLLLDRPLNVAHFGAVPNDITVDNSSAINAAAQAAGSVLEFKEGWYRCLSTLVMKASSQEWRGVGPGKWPITTPFGRSKDMAGTILLFDGAPTGTFTISGMTDQRTNEGRPVNADTNKVTPQENNYRMTHFRNNDANTGTGAAASPILQSVGVHVPFGWGNSINGIRIMRAFDIGDATVDGYTNDYDPSTGTYTNIPTGLGTATWDIGIYNEGHSRFSMTDSMTVGYWRTAGCMMSTAHTNNRGSNEWTFQGTEQGFFNQCSFQGQYGISWRGPDIEDIVGHGTNYIEVEWSDGHGWDTTELANGIASGGAGRGDLFPGTGFNFTGVQFVSGSPDRLRLTGVTPDPASTADLQTGSTVSPFETTIGLANCVLRDCEIGGMNHGSVLRVTRIPGADSSFIPSGAIEASGRGLRGLTLDNCKLPGVEEMAFFFNILTDVAIVNNTTFESNPERTNVGTGFRLVATTNTREVYIDTHYSFGFTDFDPLIANWEGNPTRFDASTGVFNPTTARIRAAEVLPYTTAIFQKNPGTGLTQIEWRSGDIRFLNAAASANILRLQDAAITTGATLIPDSAGGRALGSLASYFSDLYINQILLGDEAASADRPRIIPSHDVAPSTSGVADGSINLRSGTGAGLYVLESAAWVVK